VNRPTLQALLCLILCPLLPAQQVIEPTAPPTTPSQPVPAQRYITLPGDTNIELLPPGSTRFGKQKTGVLVQFVLDRDLLLNGKPALHALIPAIGVVESVKGTSHFKHRPAEMNIRVTEMIAGEPTDIHLRCFDPEDASGPVYSHDEPHPGFGPLKWVPLIVGGLLLLALLGGDK